MADKKQNSNSTETEYQDRLVKKVHGTVQNMEGDNLKKYATMAGIVLAVVIVSIIGFSSYNKSIQENKQAIAQDLGESLDALYMQKSNIAKPKLEALLNKGINDKIAAAKASLLLGNIYLNDREFDKAIEKFTFSIANSSEKVAIILTGAEHGLATALMQKKEYDKAISALESFISKYGKMTGDKEARYAKTEPQDLAPNVADAMWKLALCYKETKNNEKAKASCEKLLKIYGTSTYATSAKKLLAVL